MRHITFFSGGPKWGFGWGPKVYVEKVYVLFPSLNEIPSKPPTKVFFLCAGNSEGQVLNFSSEIDVFILHSASLRRVSSCPKNLVA